VEIDVPGVTEDQIDLTLEKRTLTVTVNRARADHEGWTSVMAHRPFGRFTRSFHLSEGLDAEGIQATLENGVLSLSIPVQETAKARKIEIGQVRDAIGS
jgi:HSP20 family protein